jgi:uncharacterized protein (DUF608 family)
MSLSSMQNVDEVADLNPNLILSNYRNFDTGAASNFLDRLKIEKAIGSMKTDE